MGLLTVRDVQYFVHQQGAGTPLLLLHGFTGSHEDWLPYTDAIVAAGYRFIALDLLGHGISDVPLDAWRYQMSQVAADVIAILDALEIEPSVLLGYSMGGRLALYLARHYEKYFSHLILESASPGLATEGGRMARKRRDDQLADQIVYGGIAPFVKRWEALPMWGTQADLSQEKRNALHGQRLKNHPLGLANSLRGMGTGVQPSLWDELKRIKTPTLLITGAADEKFTDINRFMAANLPLSQHIVMANAGHTVHLENPTEFWHAVFGFLA